MCGVGEMEMEELCIVEAVEVGEERVCGDGGTVYRGGSGGREERGYNNSGDRVWWSAVDKGG